MNVEKLIQQIKLRPQMYVGELNLVFIQYFIDGFLYNNIRSGRADYVDMEFKWQFHEWVREWLKKNKNKMFDEERNYVFYIMQTYQDPEECLKIFFELCEEFFAGLSRKNNKIIRNWTANNKMKKLLEEISAFSEIEELQLSIGELRKLFFPPLKKVNDCIIITEKDTEMLEAEFNNTIEMYTDKTEYEVSNTETRINSYFKNKITMETGVQIALMVIEFWALKLKEVEPDSQFRFVLSCKKDSVEIRFHKVRKYETAWLLEDFERYKDEAIGYVRI